MYHARGEKTVAHISLHREMTMRSEVLKSIGCGLLKLRSKGVRQQSRWIAPPSMSTPMRKRQRPQQWKRGRGALPPISPMHNDEDPASPKELDNVRYYQGGIRDQRFEAASQQRRARALAKRDAVAAATAQSRARATAVREAKMAARLAADCAAQELLARRKRWLTALVLSASARPGLRRGETAHPPSLLARKLERRRRDAEKATSVAPMLGAVRSLQSVRPNSLRTLALTCCCCPTSHSPR